MRIAPRVLLGIAVLGCGLASGCGSASGVTQTELVPVKGQLTYKGQPVTKGTVTFEPEDFGRPASGPIQPDGSFVLTTRRSGDGVVPGHHRVIVTDTGIKSSRDTLARKWASAAASGLTADVDAEHAEFRLDLK